jgi:bifunctional non-homologous end joining protein LigD
MAPTASRKLHPALNVRRARRGSGPHSGRIQAKGSSGPVPEYEAQLATTVAAPPEGDEWIHELKFDGYRIGLRKHGDAVELWSRRGQNWTADFPTVAAAGAALSSRQALIDGEVAVVLPTGVTSFQALQNRRPGTVLTYFAFDLLHLDGEDLRRLPVEDRKTRLRHLLDGAHSAVFRYSDHVVGGGAAFHRQACELGLEGIVSKRRNATYRAGRNADWQKTKCLRRQELVIGGFTDPQGQRRGLGALLGGYYEGDALVFAGKVGTGFDTRRLLDLRAQLDPLELPSSPFTRATGLPRLGVHWVKPELVMQVAFMEWTAHGKLRHPRLVGLRTDKAARAVVREVT